LKKFQEKKRKNANPEESWGRVAMTVGFTEEVPVRVRVEEMGDKQSSQLKGLSGNKGENLRGISGSLI